MGIRDRIDLIKKTTVFVIGTLLMCILITTTYYLFYEQKTDECNYVMKDNVTSLSDIEDRIWCYVWLNQTQAGVLKITYEEED